MKIVGIAVLAWGAAAFAVAADQKEEKALVDGHGDPLPPGAVGRLGTLRFRGNSWITPVAAVPGGKQLLGLYSFSPTIILWDATTGREIHRFEGPARRPARKADGVPFHSVSFGSFAVSPDGKTLAGATVDESGLDCPMLLFDLATGRKLAEWPGHRSHGRSGFPFLAFVTPTLLVSAGDDNSVRVWDVTRQRELHRLALPAGTHLSALVASPDREHVFVAGWRDKEAAFWMAWEARTGKLVHRQMDLEGMFVKLALAPDGATLALCMSMRGRLADDPWHTQVRIYSGPDWKERRRWRAPAGDDPTRCSIAYSPEGKTIAAGGADGKVRRWHAATGQELGPAIEPNQKHCQNCSYLDEATLFTFGFQASVNFWDTTTGQPKRAFTGSEAQVTALAYSPDGRHVAVGSGDGTRIWEAASGKQVGHLRDGMSSVNVNGLYFSPERKTLVSVDSNGVARLWDWAQGGAPIKNFATHKSPLRSVAFSPDGKSMATGDDDGTIHVWALSTRTVVHALKGHMFGITALGFSPDSPMLLSSSPDATIRQWDLGTGKEARSIRRETLGHSAAVKEIAFSPGGRWVYSAGYDASISVWEAGSGRLARALKEPETDYHGPVYIALSHNGARLAAALNNDWNNPVVHVWDLSSGRTIALRGHRAAVNQVAFSPDGRRLASGSSDTTALIWDVTRPDAGSKETDAKVPAGLWDDLGAADPKIAFAAVCQGAAAGDAAVARLQLKLAPAAAIDAAKIVGPVRQLDAADFTQRAQASAALFRLGPDAEKALRDALAKAATLEAKQRLGVILQQQEAQHRQRGHAVEVLEMIGTPAARGLLTELANGASGSRLTRDTRAALDRLKKRP